MAELQDLFAKLKRPGTLSPGLGKTSSNYQPPTVSSPIQSPPLLGPQPRGDDILSLNVTPQPGTPAAEAIAPDRTNTLLNLLKFNQATAPPDPTQTAGQNVTSDPPELAADSTHRPVLQSRDALLASGFSLQNETLSSQTNNGKANHSAHDSQQALLNLLKNAAGDESKSGARDEVRERTTSREQTPVRIFGSTEGEQADSFEPPKVAHNSGKFSYVNPFEQLASSLPPHQPTSSFRKTSRSPAAASKALKTEKSATPGRDSPRHQETSFATLEDIQDASMDMKTLKDAVHEAAIEIQQELEDPQVRAEVEKAMPTAMADGFIRTIDDVAKDAAADSWESADAEEPANDPVRVYNLPMRPFTSIDVLELKASEVRSDAVVKIASLKREFDQVDRTLAAASTNHIIYSMPKSGGIRVIRQDDGSNVALFRGKDYHVFHLSIGTSSVGVTPSEALRKEVVLATSVSGVVFWTTLPLTSTGPINGDVLTEGSFIFPPPDSSNEHSSTVQLKTRVKQSSRTPDLFAFGRGKNVWMIRPSICLSKPYFNQKTRIIDSERYLRDHCIKIQTLKAGKDFVFSGDDSVIASLDKAGRIKFWDLSQDVIGAATTPAPQKSVEIKTPILTFVVTSGTEKMMPTSIQFADKERATSRGSALRYLLVGLQQNHTIQLWDTGLGKAVQELNLPHNSENDPICSIAYHARSGIIAVGHPARNSIFFIHLSAPRYNLPAMSQADYFKRIATSDRTLPKPDSTAIMSGIREVSLSSVGRLRSLDLRVCSSSREEGEGEAATLFEMYAMNSNGVTCYTITRQDLGWDKDNKPMMPLDAQVESAVKVTELHQQVVPVETSKKTTDTVDTKPVSERQPDAKPERSSTDAPILAEASQERTKRARKLQDDNDTAAFTQESVPGIKPAIATYANIVSQTGSEQPDPVTKPVRSAAEAFSIPIVSRAVHEAPALSEAPEPITRILQEQFAELYRQTSQDRRVLEAAAAARQDALLRIVSETLTENVEKSLSNIILKAFNDVVVPSLSAAMTNVFEGRVQQKMASQLHTSIAAEMKNSVPASLAKTLQDPAITRTISSALSADLQAHMDNSLPDMFRDSLFPVLDRSFVDLAGKNRQEMEIQFAAQSKESAVLRAQESSASEQLLQANAKLLEAVQHLVETQAELRNDIQRLENMIPAQTATIEAPQAPPQPSQPPKASTDDELESIARAMQSGKLEEGTIAWLQSERKTEIFDRLFVKFDPAYLGQTNQLIALTCAAAVSESLSTNLSQRLNWLEVAVDMMVIEDEEIVRYAPKILEVLIDRLSEAYMQVSQQNPNDPILARVHSIVRYVKQLKSSLA